MWQGSSPIPPEIAQACVSVSTIAAQLWLLVMLTRHSNATLYDGSIRAELNGRNNALL
jgi:hypothetical protein